MSRVQISSRFEYKKSVSRISSRIINSCPGTHFLYSKDKKSYKVYKETIEKKITMCSESNCYWISLTGQLLLWWSTVAPLYRTKFASIGVENLKKVPYWPFFSFDSLVKWQICFLCILDQFLDKNILFLIYKQNIFMMCYRYKNSYYMWDSYKFYKPETHLFSLKYISGLYSHYILNIFKFYMLYCKYNRNVLTFFELL